MGFMEALARVDKKWASMTPEQKERRLKTLDAEGGSVAERRADPSYWTARYRLRPDHEELDLSYGGFAYFREQGITNRASAFAWAHKWNADGQLDIPFHCFGTRDLCWQLSWYIESLEGRYPEDIGAQYYPHYYLNSRYGLDLYWHVFDMNKGS